ncbi:uncharacterized protein LOC125457114 isoform X2 [Stegostoma tigrinum]|uniref:uncharacterized protein LOC125457114 isoform X2 n=1 Tax=Stegostoma tigrinum TaxID=3053191 RepID=UPI00202B9444|nr:uncharacterized protein LOC125457114 isoform X2 [Stegostoma tigrinum]
MTECGLCMRSGESRETGTLFTDGSIAAHQNCLLFSSNLVSHDSDFDDFGGFLVEDIKKEIKRGRKLKCSSCRKKGATVGCEVKICRRSYHYPCAIHDEAAVIEDEAQGIYRIYCKAHKKDMENPSPYGNCHSNNAGSDTDDAFVTVEENNLPAASNHRKSQPGSSNDDWRVRTPRKRVPSSDTDESDDLPIFTGFCVKTPVKSQNEAKHRKLENDDQMPDKERCSQSDIVAENETDPLNGDSPSLFSEVGLQSGQGGTQLNESDSTRNVHLDSRAISDENEPNDANCSDASTNLDQQEGQEEIVDIQQEVRRQMTEGTPCTSRNLCSTGRASTFWKKCKEAKCVEMIFKKMQNDLNAIQQNIINGSATDKEYDSAWTILLTLDSLQALEEFQSEIHQKLQLLEKEKSSLKIKECLVQELRGIAGSLNHKSHREK